MPLKIASVSSEYLQYLSRLDNQVLYAEGKELRPFVVVNVRNKHELLSFLIPFTSPTAKRYEDTRRNEFVVPILDPSDTSNDLGLLRINKMIPFNKLAVHDYVSPDEKKEDLINKQTVYLNSIESLITQQAQKIFNIVNKNIQEGRKEKDIQSRLSPSYLKLQLLSTQYKPGSKL